jgi:ABC-type antimicrobial peptide transport system permease subunit
MATVLMRLRASMFAGPAGVAAQPTVPLWLILLTVPVTLLAANLIAALPGWRAARLRPAAVLRSI